MVFGKNGPLTMDVEADESQFQSSSTLDFGPSARLHRGRCRCRRGCCRCWQHVRLPPRGVVRFLCWHVLKLEFWHFARPKLNLRFVSASVFVLFSSKKCNSRRAALYKNMLSSPFHIVFFRCFPVCVAFRIVFLQYSGFDLHLSFSSVRGWGGGWGG